MFKKGLVFSKIYSNIGWLLVDKLIRLLLGVLLSVWLSRYLGPDEFGLFNYSLTYIMLFSSIAGMGLQGVVVRDLIKFPDRRNGIIGTSLVITLVTGGLSYLLAILSIFFWGDKEQQAVNGLIYIIGTLLLFKAADIVQFYFESRVESKYVVWIQNGVFVFFAIIKSIMILMKQPLISFAWITATEYLLTAFFLIFVFNFKGIRIRSLVFEWTLAKQMVREATPLMLSSIAIVVYMKSDQIILGQLLDSKAVGVYSAAVRISELWYFVPIIITSSVFPNILQAKKANLKLYYSKLQGLFTLLVLISLLVALPMTFISSPLINLLYGEDYLLAGDVLSIHIWAGVFVALGQSSYYWYLAENKGNLALQRTLLGAIVNVILNLILIPRLGVIGAAYSSLIAQMLSGLIFDFIHPSTRALFVLKMKSLFPFRYVGLWNIVRSMRFRH